VKEFRRYYAERRAEFWLGVATLLGVIVIDVLPALVIGVVAMLLLTVFQVSRPHLAVLGRVPSAPGAYGDVGRHPDYEPIGHMLLLRLDSPLLYANATLVRDEVKRLVGAADPQPKVVVLDVGANPDLDITSAEMLEQLVHSLRGVGVGFALAEVRQPVVEMMRRTSLLAKVGENRIYRTIDEAVRSLGGGDTGG